MSTVTMSPCTLPNISFLVNQCERMTLDASEAPQQSYTVKSYPNKAQCVEFKTQGHQVRLLEILRIT